MNHVLLKETSVSVEAPWLPAAPYLKTAPVIDDTPARHSLGFERPTCWRGWTKLACWCTACGSGSVMIHPHHLDF